LARFANQVGERAHLLRLATSPFSGIDNAVHIVVVAISQSAIGFRRRDQTRRFRFHYRRIVAVFDCA